MQRVAQLRGRERQRQQHEQQQGRTLQPDRGPREAPVRQRARDQREHNDREQGPQWHAAFLVTEHQIRGRDQRPGDAEQPPREQDQHRCDEHVEQGPRRDPTAGRAVRAGRAEQLVSIRKMQRCRHLIEAVLPTGDRQRRARRRDAQAGAKIDRRGAPLDAARFLIRPAGDQQRLVVMVAASLAHRRSALESERCSRVKAPALYHLAVHAIAREPTAAVEIEPHLALEAEPVVLVGGEATRTLVDLQFTAFDQCERGQFAPAGRHLGLIRIDLHGTRRHAHAHARRARIAPDFLPWPRRRRQMRGDRGKRRGRTRGQGQGVVAGLHTHAQAAVRVEPRRPLAGQRERHKAYR